MQENSISKLSHPSHVRKNPIHTEVYSVDSALEHIEDTLEPVKPAVRMDIKGKERSRREIPSYMTPPRRRFLRRIRWIGITWSIVLLIVAVSIFLNNQLQDLETKQQSTQDVFTGTSGDGLSYKYT